MAPAANNPAARKYHGIRAIVVLLVKHRTIWKVCIGILNPLFFWPEQYRRTGRMSIVFLFDENPDVASAGSGGAAVGGARSVPDHAARSNSERAAPSARVCNRFSAPQIVWNKSNRCAGERGRARVGRPRRARILTITGGSSMATLRRRLRTGNDLQAADGARFGGSGVSFPIRIFLPPSLVRRKWRHAAPT